MLTYLLTYIRISNTIDFAKSYRNTSLLHTHPGDAELGMDESGFVFDIQSKTNRTTILHNDRMTCTMDHNIRTIV